MPHAPFVLAGSAAGAVLIGLEMSAGLAYPLVNAGLRAAVPLALLAGALAAGVLARRADSRRQLLLALVVGLTPLAFLRLDPPGLALVAVLAHGGLLLVGAGLGVRSSGIARHVALLRASLAACTLAVLFAPAAAPHVIWFALVPAVLAAVLVAASFAQLASGRVEALAGAPPALRVRAAQELRVAGSNGTLPRMRSVLRDVLPSALALAVLIPLSAILLESLPDPTLQPEPLDGFTAQPNEVADSADVAGEAGERTFDGVFPDGAPLGGPPRTIRHEEVMWVRSPLGDGTGGSRPIGPIYLRGNALEHFVQNGLRSNRKPTPRRYSDADDGTRDGWTTLRQGWSTRDILLEVEQAPLYLEGSGWSLLFAPAGLRAIDATPVEWEPDQVLTGRELPQEDADARHVYSLRAVERRASRLDLSNARIAAPTRRLTQLPAGSNLRRLSARARSIAQGARTPEDKLASVFAFLRDGFVYDLRTEHPPGLEGVLTFLQRRRGFCTTYASSAVALLRALDVPARVATGFCASDWIPEAGAYRVTTAQGHAWVEVLYKDLGWVVYDPTPLSEREGELASAARAPSEDFGDWAAEVLHDISRWRALGDEESWDELVDTLMLFPSALTEGVKRSPLLLLVPITLALAWAYSRRRLRASQATSAGERNAPARRQEANPLERRLVTLLRSRGYPRRPSEPLLKWSETVVADEPDLAGATLVAGWLQRARFGALPLSAEEELRARGLLDRWERAAEVR